MKIGHYSIRCRLGLVFSILFLMLAVWIAVCIGRVDFSTRLMLAACALSLAYVAFGALSRKKRWAKALCLVYECCLGLAMVTVLSVTILLNATASRSAVTEDTPAAKYVIVFGAGLHGETPSLMLSRRLETARDYLELHPDSVAILSGGQGERESITEAEAMRRQLTAWGIDEKRLILEENSTDTRENALYSAELMEDTGELTVAVSNAFHLRRCLAMLEEVGVTNVRSLSAPLPSAGAAVSMYIRETVATLYHFIFS